jgi:hypothetical protein
MWIIWAFRVVVSSARASRVVGVCCKKWSNEQHEERKELETICEIIVWFQRLVEVCLATEWLACVYHSLQVLWWDTRKLQSPIDRIPLQVDLIFAKSRCAHPVFLVFSEAWQALLWGDVACLQHDSRGRHCGVALACLASTMAFWSLLY